MSLTYLLYNKTDIICIFQRKMRFYSMAIEPNMYLPVFFPLQGICRKYELQYFQGNENNWFINRYMVRYGSFAGYLYQCTVYMCGQFEQNTLDVTVIKNGLYHLREHCRLCLVLFCVVTLCVNVFSLPDLLYLRSL